MLRKVWFIALLLVLAASGSLAAESLQIHWKHSPNVVRYVIYRSTSETTGFVAIDSTGAAPADTIYLDHNVSTSTRYYYRLTSRHLLLHHRLKVH